MTGIQERVKAVFGGPDSQARAVMRRWAYRIPGYFEWRSQRALKPVPWKFTAAGRSYEAMVPDEWLREIQSDEGVGKVTGVDRKGRYEAAFCDKFLSKVSESSVLLDVGANYGLYSVMASRSCPPKHIHSFEPDRAARWVLGLNNVRYCNGQLNVVPLAVGSREAPSTTTLDDYCERHGIEPTLVKMDIEGAEIHALAGMRQICTRYRPVILMEFHLRKLRQLWHAEPSDVLAMLRGYGYRLRFNGHHWHLVVNQGEWDAGWHDQLPNDVNCAVLAEPED